MAEDLELGVVLKVDDSEIDDVNNELETSVETEEDAGDGGGLFTATNIVLGLLTAILSQLQGAQSILSGLFRILNLVLTPIWQGIASAVRPLADLFMQVSQAIQRFGVGDIIRTAMNKFLNQLTSFINSTVNNFKNALNQIPGVSVDTDSQTVTRDQTVEGLETVGNVAQLSNPGSMVQGASGLIADGLEQLEILTADMQDEEKKETTGSYVADLVDEVI